MARFFGTNGIRGIFDRDLRLEFVHDMTLALGTFFGKGSILVGYDGRHSSPLLTKLVTSTLNSIGIDSNIAGLVPTPCLEYAVRELGYIGGIMITASHNPPEYNGLKPVAADGVEISRDDEIRVESIYDNIYDSIHDNIHDNKSWYRPTQWGTTSNESRAVQTYLDGILKHLDHKSITSKRFKVVLDLGNGTQAVTAPKLCELLGCDVHVINDNIDGNFGGRGSEPTPNNLKELSDVVTQTLSDLGIAFDGDGDRSMFCDNTGTILTGDKSALILSQHILQKSPGGTLVTGLNSGSGIEHISSMYDSKVIRTKVGSVEISRTMTMHNALIGFEENGGFMYGPYNCVRDGCMTLGLMLEMLSSTDKSLSEITCDLPASFTTKDKVPCSSHLVSNVIDTLKEEYPAADTTDGIKITLDSNTWVMIRPSGTEPILRIYAEATTREKLDSLMSSYIAKVRSIITTHQL